MMCVVYGSISHKLCQAINLGLPFTQEFSPHTNSNFKTFETCFIIRSTDNCFITLKLYETLYNII